MSRASRELDLARENERLEALGPEARLAFAIETFGEKLLFTSSFGAQSAVLLHLWSTVAKGRPVTFIDTGFLFPETLAYRDRLAAQLDLTVDVVRPDMDRSDFVARYGDDIQSRDPDFCCGLNKTAPLSPRKEGALAWVSGLRRDQSRTRATVRILEDDGAPESKTVGVDVHQAHRLVRVHPIADLGAADVKAYLTRHSLPEHPLAARRYLSIGCAPCTRAVADGEEERAGRWAWSSKTECGLHARPNAERR